MNKHISKLVGLSALLCSVAIANEQQQLDEACEAAREIRLAPLRAELVTECVEKQNKDREYCETFYADWDGNRGEGRGRMFYDLPECEAAFKYSRENKR